MLIYSVFFVSLVIVQFSKRSGFTHRVGSFVVSGQYRLPGENDTPMNPNEYLLDGDTHVFFGGVDFSMIAGNDESSLTFIGLDGDREKLLPERMLITGDTAFFIFPGGTWLEFTTHHIGGALEMQISAVFSEDITGIELPFRFLRRTGIRDAGDGQFIVIADGVNYTFGRSPMDLETRMLLFSAEGRPISYRAIPEQRAFSPYDFILPQGETAESYHQALRQWRDQNFSLWNRTVTGNNEDLVVAYAAEALVRGTYRAALAAVPTAFLVGPERSYVSSVYLGGLEQAQRMLINREREKLARLSRLINENSLEFLKEPNVFEYLATRGHINIFDAGADLVRTIDPAALALDITPGIFEGYVDWNAIRPNTENPFEHLADQACFVISQSLRRSVLRTDDGSLSERVFSFIGSQGDTEYNLRLGKALVAYAESTLDEGQDGSWAGIGRSLILSALSMTSPSGAVSAGLIITEHGEIIEDPGPSALTSARLHQILSPTVYQPRAVPISTSTPPVWAWTAALDLRSVQQNDAMEIFTNFPAGETHHMIISGIRPFVRVQLHETDWRTDPQFERYDSSGWRYFPQEQTLIVKMRHRTQTESIRIIFWEETPVPDPASPAADDNASGADESSPVVP